MNLNFRIYVVHTPPLDSGEDLGMLKGGGSKLLMYLT